MDTERVQLDTLELYPENPRKGNVQMIIESLTAHGQVTPLLVQKSTRYVLGGNHTLMGMRRMGWEEGDVVWADVDDQQARKIMLALNRASDVGTYDQEMLAEVLASLSDDLTGSLYSPDDIDDLLAALDKMPVLPEQPTLASYRETEDQIQQRLESWSDRQPKTAFGVREAVLVLPQDQYSELQGHIAALRSHLDAEMTSGEVVLEALRIAVKAVGLA